MDIGSFKRGDRRRFRGALAAAVALHTALIAISVPYPTSGGAPPRHDGPEMVRPRATPLAEVELDLSAPEALPPQGDAVASVPVPASERGPDATGAQAAMAPRGSRGRSQSPSNDETAAHSGEERAELGTIDGQGQRPGAEKSSKERPAQRGLTLEQLGIGAQNHFAAQRTRPQAAPHGEPGPRREAGPRADGRVIAKRVDRMLVDGIAQADQRRGLGPEGPLLASLEEEARRGLTLANSSALFRLSTDGRGTLVGVQVIDANSGQAEWQKLGERVLARLGKQRLRGAHGAKGLSFEVRVTARVTLPSGRDPGLEIDLFGVPVKKGDGEKSTRIRIVDALPTYSLEDFELEDGRVVQVPVLRQSVLGLDGDPVDIGAPARRMIHARLERLWAN